MEAVGTICTLSASLQVSYLQERRQRKHSLRSLAGALLFSACQQIPLYHLALVARGASGLPQFQSLQRCSGHIGQRMPSLCSPSTSLQLTGIYQKRTYTQLEPPVFTTATQQTPPDHLALVASRVYTVILQDEIYLHLLKSAASGSDFISA